MNLAEKVGRVLFNVGIVSLILIVVSEILYSFFNIDFAENLIVFFICLASIVFCLCAVVVTFFDIDISNILCDYL